MPEAEPVAEPETDIAEPTASATTELAAAEASASSEVTRLHEQVRDGIVALQQRFGSRIERILGQRRSTDGAATGGLLVVLDRVDEHDDAAIEGLSNTVPVALIDRRTLASLGRLGAASPIADAEPVYEPGTAPPTSTEHPLCRKARENLEAARLLTLQACPAPALDLLLAALLAAGARRAGRGEPPTPQQAGIWLYGEALAAGQLEPQDAALLMRAIALAQGADAVPEPLLSGLVDDAADFIDRVAAV